MGSGSVVVQTNILVTGTEYLDGYHLMVKWWLMAKQCICIRTHMLKKTQKLYTFDIMVCSGINEY